MLELKQVRGTDRCVNAGIDIKRLWSLRCESLKIANFVKFEVEQLQSSKFVNL